METVSVYFDPKRTTKSNVLLLVVGAALLALAFFGFRNFGGYFFAALQGACAGGGIAMVFMGILGLLRGPKMTGVAVATLTPEGLDLLVPQSEYSLSIDTTMTRIPWEEITNVGSRKFGANSMVTLDLVNPERLLEIYTKKQRSFLTQAKRASKADLSINTNNTDRTMEEIKQLLSNYRDNVLRNRQTL